MGKHQEERKTPVIVVKKRRTFSPSLHFVVAALLLVAFRQLTKTKGQVSESEAQSAGRRLVTLEQKLLRMQAQQENISGQ